MGWKDELTSFTQNRNNPSKLRFDEPLSKHNYFGIGGNAAAYFEVSTTDELAYVAQLKKRWERTGCHRWSEDRICWSAMPAIAESSSD